MEFSVISVARISIGAISVADMEAFNIKLILN